MKKQRLLKKTEIENLEFNAELIRLVHKEKIQRLARFTVACSYVYTKPIG